MSKKFLSSECKYCNKLFYFSKFTKNNNYCSDFCEDKRGKSICKICLKEFKNNAERVTCSKKCLSKYIKYFYKKCNNKNFFWQLLSKALQSNSKIVSKSWGLEIHFCNNNNYCMKYLVYFKNNQSSFHFHEIKTELWYCLYGKFDCIMQKGGNKKIFKITSGDKLEISPKVKHQLRALDNSIILEVSTRDYPEDSIKLAPPCLTQGGANKFTFLSK